MYVELCEAMEQHDQELTGRLLPVLKQRIDEATHALSDCLEIKDVAVHWYGIFSSFIFTCFVGLPRLSVVSSLICVKL